ncbi:MAG: CpaE family protein [Bryobacteraceae bacterium]
MPYQITLGLIIATKEWRQELQACLDNASVRIVVDEPDFGEMPAFLERLERIRPDAVLIDFTRLKEPYDDLISQLKATSASPLIVALHKAADPETILSIIHAGADEYLYPPFSTNLGRALERISTRTQQKQNVNSTAGKILGFFSAKGGCGATTIACHTAVELSRQTSQEVLLADFDLDAGLVGFLMKSKSRYSILDAMGNTHRLDASYWRALISNGMPRLQVIRAPGAIPQRDDPKKEDVHTVLRFVRFQYDWTLVDLGRGLNPLVSNALDEVDEAFLVTTLDVPALHQVQQIVRNLLDIGYAQERLRLVLNRVPKSPDVMPNELEGLLGIPVYSMLPDDYGSIYEAYAEGHLVPSNTGLGRQFARMAASIAGLQEQSGKKKFSLFGG